MKIFIALLCTLISAISFSDNRKILSYQVERDISKKHIKIKINEESFRYRIIYGDTLNVLVKELDTSVDKLARDNKIKNINKIYAGEGLNVEKKHSNYKEETTKEEKKDFNEYL